MALKGGLPSGEADVGGGPALEASQSPAQAPRRVHTWIVEVEVQRVPDQAIGLHGAVGTIDLREVAHTLVPQVAHEELQANEGEDTEAEDCEDHHVGQLLHRLDQGPHNGLQAWARREQARGRPEALHTPLPKAGGRPEGVLGQVGSHEVGAE